MILSVFKREELALLVNAKGLVLKTAMITHCYGLLSHTHIEKHVSTNGIWKSPPKLYIFMR
jgi:hypothetical protein